MKIYYFSPDIDDPIGGIKQIYRHVKILNSAGFEARVLHRKEGFRISWFDNEVPISYIGSSINDYFSPVLNRLLPSKERSVFDRLYIGSDLYEMEKGKWKTVQFDADDILVIPEFLGSKLIHLIPEVKKIIFNQNAYSTFYGHSLKNVNEPLQTIYQMENVLGAIVVSEDNQRYLQYGFPELPIYRVFNGIDNLVFKNNGKKEKLITCMPRKLNNDIVQVISLLKTKDLKGWQFVLIDKMKEKQVAEILGKASIFMSFSLQEGLPLPPLEAAFSGCVLVGYTGNGADEYFLPNLTYPVQQGKTLEFAKSVESIIDSFENDPTSMYRKADELSAFVKERYSLENERNSVISTWKSILSSAAVK